MQKTLVIFHYEYSTFHSEQHQTSFASLPLAAPKTRDRTHMTATIIVTFITRRSYQVHPCQVQLFQ